jgi:hypothetical protein
MSTPLNRATLLIVFEDPNTVGAIVRQFFATHGGNMPAAVRVLDLDIRASGTSDRREGCFG